MIYARIKVNGLVQGIGFRPFVAELAEKLNITGSVRNAGGIVFIEAFGESEAIREMMEIIRSSPPPGGIITGLEVSEDTGTAGTEADIPDSFRIIKSTFDRERVRVIPPDIATCPDCERELKDPANRRFHYPFISCTKCGPRFTIMSKVPYDREFTTMEDFPLCDECRAEYVRYGDIRRHGQTICCGKCGPHVNLICGTTVKKTGYGASSHSGDGAKDAVPEAEDSASVPFDRRNSECAGMEPGAANPDERVMLAACDMLEEGKILAVKNVGGYHFACRADRKDTIERLRAYKKRPRKQLAVMVRDLKTAKKYCRISKKEAELLTSPARPIVLLDLKDEVLDSGTFRLVTDSLRLGVMLPSDPILILLAERFECLVMTSGNLSGEPMLASNHQMEERVRTGFPDAALIHNRRILYPLDDSIVQTIELGGEEKVQTIRRARGYVPFGIGIDRGRNKNAEDQSRAGEANVLARGADVKTESVEDVQTGSPDVLACGADVKGGFALLSADEVIPGGHFPDLTGKTAYDSYRNAVNQVIHIFESEPKAVVCDLHPEYHSVRFAEEFSRKRKIPLYRVQHHTAHALSVSCENHLQEATLDIVLDGTGFGADGTIWGGELFANAKKRAGHLRSITYQGRNDIARKAEKAGLCILNMEKAGRGQKKQRLKKFFGRSDMTQAEGELILKALNARINTFESSSCGRIFDGMAGLLGIISESSYEGEAAEMLQDEAERYLKRHGFPKDPPAYPAGENYLETDVSGLEIIDTAGLAADLYDAYNNSDRTKADREEYAWRFICALSECIVTCGKRIIQKETSDEIRAVTLSGGCIQNRLLLKLLWEQFSAAGYQVYMNHQVPAGDGGIALGQEAYYVRCVSGKSDQH